jgi:GTP-binding protein
MSQKPGSQTRAEFVVSAVSERDFPHENGAEIVLAGRSNVGKSSLINRLSGIKGLARTSSTPGKTQAINFYRFDGAFFIVDLPGFGYAKVSKEASRSWRRLIETYFRERSAIALAVHLVDARIPPTELDLELAQWLDHLGVQRTIVATKSDKLSGNQRAAQSRLISEAFDGAPVILSSAATGAGYAEIWKSIVAAVHSNSSHNSRTRP